MFMRNTCFLRFILLCCFLSCFACELQCAQRCGTVASLDEDSSFYPHFSDNPAITEPMHQLMDPYLLPMDHSMKVVLDDIFARSRVVENDQSLVAAGFTILFSQKRSLIRVVKHPRIQGYLLKMYLDSDAAKLKEEAGWERLAMRCAIAEKIKNFIAQDGIKSFVVADKWLYPLPVLQNCRPEQQLVVLLVKDMDIYNRVESGFAWKAVPNRAMVKELYTVLAHGYGSAALDKNVPYTKSGTFAFIDTEYKKGKKVSLRQPRNYLSTEMQAYWDTLALKEPAKETADANV